MLRDYIKRLYREAAPLLYSRKKFKLFLRRSLQDVDSRIRDVMLSINVLPSIINPVPLRPPFGKSMLVIAPHQDDEIIGCGGMMVLQKDTGGLLKLVFVMDGGDEFHEDGYSSRKELVDIREKEALLVAGRLGIESPVFLRQQAFNDADVSTVAEKLHDCLVSAKADVVLTPFILDHNHDHRLTNFALAHALLNIKDKPRILGYEVWGLCIPNVIVNIDKVMPEKQHLLSLYKSQLKGTDYLNCTTGLNMYHSRTFGAGECKFAERFFEMPGDEFVDVVGRLRNEASGY